MHNSSPSSWQHLATFCHYWQLLPTFGTFWQLLPTFTNIWQILSPCEEKMWQVRQGLHLIIFQRDLFIFWREYIWRVFGPASGRGFPGLWPQEELAAWIVNFWVLIYFEICCYINRTWNLKFPFFGESHSLCHLIHWASSAFWHHSLHCGDLSGS